MKPTKCTICKCTTPITYVVLRLMSRIGKFNPMYCREPHTKPFVRGVASVALRSLAIAAECLIDRREQEEVLQIFEKISKETGWRIGFLHKELKQKWGWVDEEALRQQQMGSSSVLQSFQYQPSSQSSNLPPTPAVRRFAGITNPLMASADFTSQHHPYQSHYVAPNQHPHHNHYNF